MPPPGRHSEAFKEGLNVVGLTTAIALSAAMLNPLPLLVGLVAEAAYLLFVPDSKWYETRLSKRFDAEVEQRRQKLKEQVLPGLRPDLQERFGRLEEMRHEIGAQPLEGQSWFREVLRKLDYLLEKFLLFAGKEVQFRSYLQSVIEEIRSARQRGGKEYSAGFEIEVVEDRRGRRVRPLPAPGRGTGGEQRRLESLRPGNSPIDSSERWVQQTIQDIQSHYDGEVESLKNLIGEEQDENTRAVLEKRLDVLTRRREGVGKMGKILVNLNHQLKLLEDTFGLINDEIRARSPEQVLSDIEDVVWQTDTMTRLLEDLAPYEQMAERMTG